MIFLKSWNQQISRQKSRKFLKIFRFFFRSTKNNYFFGTESFFDIPYRSEILCTFDFWHFQGDLGTVRSVAYDSLHLWLINNVIFHHISSPPLPFSEGGRGFWWKITREIPKIWIIVFGRCKTQVSSTSVLILGSIGPKLVWESLFHSKTSYRTHLPLVPTWSPLSVITRTREHFSDKHV